ncbi:hypothetical protein QWY20_09315 [Alkalimonas sp. MEB108]|uniref:Uncharacterized protein n=1 Tax=Alkalimonas cellulosilytica TaxID=3058395 RepID=A0ABU7J5U5_9GAMM|nr:hypothetical protein [Alkalimonas sp. MEB108]MEE2001650.1 hypothetical protein [Alkalimonas sp. MEB108]
MYFTDPYLFDDAKLAAANYPEELVPDMLWGASPNDLRNVSESDVFLYQWDELEDPIKAAEIVSQGLPHIVIGSLVFVGVKRVAKAA